MGNPRQLVTLSNCEREPIHIPGPIQPFGILLALDGAELRIDQISQNVETILVRSVESLVGKSLSYLISSAQFETLRILLLNKDTSLPLRKSLDLKKKNGSSETWDALIHRQEK